MATECDHNFNKIDSELRQLEGYIIQLEAKLAAAEMRAISVAKENERLLEVIRRSELDVRANLNPMLERMNRHPFTLLEKDLREALGGE